MYKIIGADGKEYGPATIEQMRRWIAEGRVNPQTKVLAPDAAEYRMASEVPELQDPLRERSESLAATGTNPGVFAMGTDAGVGMPQGKPKQGLAITSMVLGILAFLCFGLITGLPAILTGHIAHNRARRDPARYGGSGFAIAGFILGYCSIIITIILAAMLLPALSRAKGRAQEINCISNLKQIALAFKTWTLDNNDLFPSNVSTNDGGAMELTRTVGPVVQDPTLNFQILSNELSTPKLLVCPADNGKVAASAFPNLTKANITYELRAFSGIETNAESQLVVCPVHGHSALVDGSVQRGNRK